MLGKMDPFLYLWWCEKNQINLLFLNANPELDFKYFSKLLASCSDLKHPYQAINRGL